MLYATMKTFLQRRLQDTVADQFASSVVDDLLLVGIAKLQAFIHDINPTAFIDRNTFNTVASTDLYAKQASSLRVIRAEMLRSSGTGYDKLPVRNFHQIVEDENAFVEGAVAIADLGTKWLISPTPDSIRTVRIWYVPVITSSTIWDSYALLINPALHFLPVDLALVEALGETAEGAAEARSRINESLALLPSLYGVTGEQTAPLNLQPFSG